MTPCGFGEGCGWARSEELQNWVRDCGRCDVCDNLFKEVVVSNLFSTVVPMLRAHAERAWFACVSGVNGDQLSNLRLEDVRHRSLRSGCRVRIGGVQAFGFFRGEGLFC